MQIEVIIEKKSHKLDAEEGKTILETLQEHGIHVLTAPCGGRGRCGKCTVEVEHMGEVLACMTKVTDGMRIQPFSVIRRIRAGCGMRYRHNDSSLPSD